MVSNMVMNVVFVGLLLKLAFQGPHTGLALASSIAAYINAGLLYRGLRRQAIYQPVNGWLVVIIGVFAACAVMLAGLAWYSGDVNLWASLGAVDRGLRLLALIAGAVVAYTVVLLIAGLRKKHLEKGAS